MNSIETVATFFGWCAVINIGVILAFLLLMSVMNKDGFLVGIAVKIFGITRDDTLTITFQIFQQFRLLVVVFNIAPYFALKLMV